MTFYQFVRPLLAAVLLVSATSKLFDFEAILGSGGLLASPLRLSLVVGFELFAALVIMTAPGRIAHRFGLFVFSTLACFAAWAWWTQTDCGCFGARTPRALPFLIDAAAISLLLLCGNRLTTLPSGKPDDSTSRLASSMVAALFVAVLGTGATAWRIDMVSHESEMPLWFGDNLVGAELPLFVDERFEQIIPTVGNVLLVLLRHDCDHCRELAEGWTAIYTTLPTSMTIIGISVSTDAWTVMPGAVSASPLQTENGFMMRWGNAGEPFVAAPTLIAVRDRTVVSVRSGDDAITTLQHDLWWNQLFQREEL